MSLVREDWLLVKQSKKLVHRNQGNFPYWKEILESLGIWSDLPR